MPNSLTYNRLLCALEKVKGSLYAEKSEVEGGDRGECWRGELSSSPLSTATAVSALSMYRLKKVATTISKGEKSCQEEQFDLIEKGLNWIVKEQNDDGGWGDTNRSLSNISTTMLAKAAFHLGAKAFDSPLDQYHKTLENAERYISKVGGTQAIKERYGSDKTFAVPILMNCALAGFVPWKEVAPLPFEAAAFPPSLFRFLGLPVVSYAIPALVAVGTVKFLHDRPRNWFVRKTREITLKRSLASLCQKQPESGGFLEAAPLTAFVTMSLLASYDKIDHPAAKESAREVIQKGVEFLVQGVRKSGAWPIDTDLAIWNTTLAVNALANVPSEPIPAKALTFVLQNQEIDDLQSAGWGWTDHHGSLPDADDTPGALLALAGCYEKLEAEQEAVSYEEGEKQAILQSASRGVQWLLGLQNRDGGWPTFCRGWTKQEFDKSGADLSAHTIRALFRWKNFLPVHRRKIERGISRGLDYLAKVQAEDGSYSPLWFGNQHEPDEENRVYGTAKVCRAFLDLGLVENSSLKRGVFWLLERQNSDGTWGVAWQGGRSPQIPQKEKDSKNQLFLGSFEETALAIETLCDPLLLVDEPVGAAVEQGLATLVKMIEQNEFKEASPIGLYFAKLWYYERLYPLLFGTAALGRGANFFEKHLGNSTQKTTVEKNNTTIEKKDTSFKEDFDVPQSDPEKPFRDVSSHHAIPRTKATSSKQVV